MAVWTHTSHSGKKYYSNQVQPALVNYSQLTCTYILVFAYFLYAVFSFAIVQVRSHTQI